MAKKKKQDKKEKDLIELGHHHKPLIVDDIKLLRKLSTRFMQSGVLDRKGEILDNDSNVDNFFQEATDNAKYEKELNSEHYHADLESLVKAKELGQTEDFANPSLDGIDDYGRQMYDDSRKSDEKRSPVDDFKEKSSGGSTIEALKLTFETHGINPFEEGVYNKHTPVNTIENVNSEENKDEIDKAGKPDEETINMYSKILAKAKLPTTGF